MRNVLWAAMLSGLLGGVIGGAVVWSQLPSVDDYETNVGDISASLAQYSMRCDRNYENLVGTLVRAGVISR
jgi:hypothetical protein